jgi:hypothetical protein
LLKPWKFLFGNGKKKRRRRSSCTTKMPTTKSTRVVKKIVQLCHTTKSKHLTKQLPLSQEEATGPSPIGSSLPIGLLPCIKPMLQHHLLSHHKQQQLPKPNNKRCKKKRWHIIELEIVEVYGNQACQEEQQ